MRAHAPTRATAQPDAESKHTASAENNTQSPHRCLNAPGGSITTTSAPSTPKTTRGHPLQTPPRGAPTPKPATTTEDLASSLETASHVLTLTTASTRTAHPTKQLASSSTSTKAPTLKFHPAGEACTSGAPAQSATVSSASGRGKASSSIRLDATSPSQAKFSAPAAFCPSETASNPSLNGSHSTVNAPTFPH